MANEGTRPVGDECGAVLGWVLSVGDRWRRVPGAPRTGWAAFLLSEVFEPSSHHPSAAATDRALGIAAVLARSERSRVSRWARHPARSAAFAEGVALTLRVADEHPRAARRALHVFRLLRRITVDDLELEIPAG